MEWPVSLVISLLHSWTGTRSTLKGTWLSSYLMDVDWNTIRLFNNEVELVGFKLFIHPVQPSDSAKCSTLKSASQ
ncbi:hypothetical protein B0H12DRAFT_1122550 [Mycena haematopus]|nr:hypothetical protein B0H12DRAFT_1122550 [Mycena haematopus]